MKKCLFNIFAAIIIFFCAPRVMAIAAETGYLDNVILEKLPGKERVVLVVSTQPAITVESQSNGNLVFKLEDMSVPENLRHSFGENQLDNISSVVLSQQSLEGKQLTYLMVKIKEVVPYVVKQEGKNIYIDFNISDLPEKKIQVSKASSLGKTQIIKKQTVSRNNTNKYVSLDFQDADIKSVLRLMAEYGNISIVAGDDVKGNVTLTMKNVPWEQALDTILDVNGLAKKKMGDVISVMTLTKKKKDEEDKAKSEEDQRKAEDLRKDRELKVMVEKGLLKQILIEAKIVEANELFIRNIGVTWGFTTTQSTGSYGMRYTGGSSTSQANAQSFSYPSQIPYVKGNTTDPLTTAAVNFPTQPALAKTFASPAIGVVFGGAAGFLEAQIAALEANATGKVISAPKVVTMEGVKATIKQGAEVPYVTPASGTSPATVSFKEALLKLEVKPKITDEGKISMEITATNDQPDFTNTVQGNPPINKSELISTVLVQDGDTVVIGGVFKSTDNNDVSGLPWLQKIPVLGWLFKTDNTTKEKRQILIFVTPKILKGSGIIQTSEKLSKITILEKNII